MYVMEYSGDAFRGGTVCISTVLVTVQNNLNFSFTEACMPDT